MYFPNNPKHLLVHSLHLTTSSRRASRRRVSVLNSADDEHTAEEAGAHTVVTIRKAGTYRVSGSLSAGQLAVDLGDDAKTDPSSVVTLILDGVDITCTVAPAVIFYNVYECDADFVAYDNEETDNYVSSPTVDTSAAGANVY